MSRADRNEAGRIPNIATAGAPTDAQGDSEKELKKKPHTGKRRPSDGELGTSHPGPIREKRQRG